MVSRALAPALILLVALAGGCDTTQPVSKSAQGAQISFEANAPKVLLYDVWDAQLVTVTRYPSQPDLPPDQTVTDLGLWCDQDQDPLHPEYRERLSATYPFRFSVEIDRIPAGSSTVEIVSEREYATGWGSVTAYDDSPPEPPTTHPVDWTIDVSDPATPNTTALISLANGRRISTASRDFVETVKLPTTGLTYGSRCPYGGASSGPQLGEPSVAGSPSFFPVEINTGDTIIVKARKDPNPATISLYTANPPTFGSKFYVGGRDVSSSIVGIMYSPQGTQDGISYSFTLR